MLQFAFMTRAVIWGLWRVGADSGIGAGFVWIALSLVAAGVIATVQRARPPVRAPRLLLVAQPAVWVLIGIWGLGVSLMHRDPGRAAPLWVFYPIEVGFLVFVALGLFTIVYLRGGRVFAALFFAVNFGLALMVCVFADMAVSGMR